MCRWAAYVGPPIYLEEIIASPTQSLIAQSLRARECASTINGDGFGVAWWAHRSEPGLFRDVQPAWSDPNLRSVARQVRSSMFMAHVRASTGAPTSRLNCHPFVHGRWAFMHNGQISRYEGRMRRRIDMMLSEALYDRRQGATDSETMFLLAVQMGLEEDPKGALERMVGAIEAVWREEHGEPENEPAVKLTAALSDGERLYAVRYASHGAPPTLYHRRSERFGGRALVSEPLDAPDDAAHAWTPAPEGRFLEVGVESVGLSEFAPQR